jgi:predicted ester cyclase
MAPPVVRAGVVPSAMDNDPSNADRLMSYGARMIQGDTAAVADHFDEGFVTHVADRVEPLESEKKLRNAEARYWSEAHAAFPDMEMTVNVMIETGEYVVTNWTLKGTHTGAPFFGVPPSGQPVKINGTAIVRFENGKAVEHWGGPHCMNAVGIYRKG